MTKVLVVEDNNMIRANIMELLEMLGITAFEATDGLEAIEMLRQHPEVELIFSDIDMPNMNGIELYQHAAVGKRKFVFMSANVMTSVDLREGDAFIIKPFQMNQLVAHLS